MKLIDNKITKVNADVFDIIYWANDKLRTSYYPYNGKGTININISITLNHLSLNIYNEINRE